MRLFQILTLSSAAISLCGAGIPAADTIVCMHRVLLLSALLAFSLNGQSIKIVVQNPAVLKELQASGEIPPQVKLVTAAGADLTREIADADGFVGGPLSAADLKAAKKLRWVQSFSAGVERQLFLSGNTIMIFFTRR